MSSRVATAEPGRDANASVETPDIETSSADYASRFSGDAGRYLLDTQARCIAEAIRDLAPGSVLDVGGGHGQLVGALSKAGWRVTVHGTDPACEKNLRELHGHTECRFVTGPLNRLPAADRSFDLVIAVRLLPHVNDWPALLREMCRVARRSVVVDYPSKGGLNALTPLLFGVKKSLEGNTRRYASFSRRELEPTLSGSGFRVRTEQRQFFLPMVVHRVGKAAPPLRAAEQIFRQTGLTRVAGSPVILRADRVS
jgi:ubiquinone/menaquinone biosynthesis C-methylase UbiE